MDTSLTYVDLKRRDVPLLPILGCIVAAMLLTEVTLTVAHYVFGFLGLLR
jgi:hypothetical protein